MQRGIGIRDALIRGCKAKYRRREGWMITNVGRHVQRMH